ncbi:hypothetical protein WN55_02448 [Dufourea novaeangliae]|uniref:Uncharacterized protein n=1 Tax=Dufourea novaeangliae TaxID=178035 RepID=A0A154PH12_DUFNO|nr:hypothetical protein WN55_02448 [Dufourea novaeangliae]
MAHHSHIYRRHPFASFPVPHDNTKIGKDRLAEQAPFAPPPGTALSVCQNSSEIEKSLLFYTDSPATQEAPSPLSRPSNLSIRVSPVIQSKKRAYTPDTVAIASLPTNATSRHFPKLAHLWKQGNSRKPSTYRTYRCNEPPLMPGRSLSISPVAGKPNIATRSMQTFLWITRKRFPFVVANLRAAKDVKELERVARRVGQWIARRS